MASGVQRVVLRTKGGKSMIHTTIVRVTRVLVILSALVVPVRGQTPQKNSPPPSDHDRTAAADSQAAGMQLVEMNVAERDLGKLAAKKAQNRRVKDFADMMVKDHGQAVTRLKSVQGTPATEPKPNAKHQEAADHLSKLSGAEFDREYIDAMVSGHQEAAMFLQRLSGQESGSGPSVKGGEPIGKAAQELLPTVRQHLQTAQDIQKELQSGATTDSKPATGRK
jgi:putative membrane protein